MPRVPTRNIQVQQQGITGARYQENAPIEAFGGGAAVQGLSKAVGDVTGVIGDIYKEEKQKADQAVLLEADRKTAEQQGIIEKAVKDNFQGKNAAKSWEYSSEEWQKRIPDIEDSLSSPDQRAAYQKSKADRWTSMNRFIQSHTQVEVEKYENGEMVASNANETANGISHYGDLEEVALSAGRIKDNYSRFLISRGIPEGSQQHKDLINDALSPMHLGVIDKNIENGRYEQAKQYYTDTKKSGQLKGPQLEKAEGLISSARVIHEGDKIWEKAKKSNDFYYPTGDINEEAVRNMTTKLSGISEKDRNSVVTYLDARIHDEIIITNRRHNIEDKDFKSKAIKARELGSDVAEVMMLAEQKSRNPLDKSTKQQWVRNMYAGKTTSDPEYVQKLETRVIADEVSEAEVTAEWKAGRINQQEWDGFVDTLRKNKYDDLKSERKRVDDFVNTNLKSMWGNQPKQVAKFKSVYREQTAGMTPQQAEAKYFDLLEKHKDSFFQKNWQVEYEAQTKRHKDTASQINKLSSEFGKDAVDNAVKSIPLELDRNGKAAVATPANIRWYLQQYPTGVKKPNGR